MKEDERKHWLFLAAFELNPKFHTTKQMWSIKDFQEKLLHEKTHKTIDNFK